MELGRRVVNFGGNVAFVPTAIERPRSADEVTAAMQKRPGERFRCIGAGHSWNRILATDGVLFDIRELNAVEVDASEGVVRAGAGCTLERLLGELARAGYTLPTLGAITRQTLAGAISTGTHGTGHESLSHEVTRARIATFDPDSGNPELETFTEGDALRAARCALGALGVIVELTLRIRRSYRIEECVETTQSIEAVLAGRGVWPLQQFALLPWSWTYVVYRRRQTEAQGSRLRAWLLKALNFVGTDVLLHLVLEGLLLWARLFGEGSIRAFFRRIVPHLVTRYRARIDDSQTILTMRHDLFRHVEMELFVPEQHLQDAIAAIRQLVALAGEGATQIDRLASLEPELLDAVWKLRGSYTLHYPLFFRRVLPDDTLISMTSRAEYPVSAWYSISFFTYRRPQEDFARFARTLARCMSALFGARLHWGKYFPLPLEEAARAYPGFEAFAEICRNHDPEQRFAVFDVTDRPQPVPAA
jgi:FAD/FMN-containing dehydrogenase